LSGAFFRKRVGKILFWKFLFLCYSVSMIYEHWFFVSFGTIFAVSK